MQNNNQTVVDLYAIIHEADSSFQVLSRITRKSNYEIELFPLDLFERYFRQLYNLKRFDERIHPQQVPVRLKTEKKPDKEIFISEEFLATLCAYYSPKNIILEQGYIMLCAGRKIFPGAGDFAEIDRGIIIQDLEKMKRFTDKLESSLHLARYGYVSFHSHFARIHTDNRIISLIDTSSPLRTEKQNHFVQKDNALIEALLTIDCRIPDYIQLTIKAFEESFHIRHQQVKFLHLINCLEICFSTDFADFSIAQTARYCALLLASNKREYLNLYTEMIRLFTLKKDILKGSLTELIPVDIHKRFCQQLSFLEETTRNVIKKVLYLNSKSREELFYKLDLKTLPGHFGQAVKFSAESQVFRGEN